MGEPQRECVIARPDPRGPRERCKIGEMKVKEALELAQEKLNDVREAHYLLSSFLRRDLSFLYAHPEEELEGSPAELLRWIEMRSRGVPLAYLSHLKEFYGRQFYLDHRVLIPRPETEILIEEAISLGRELRRGNKGGKGLTFFDLGTGSGCLAVTLALEFEEAEVLASDISPEVLEVARINAGLHKVQDRVTLLQGDLFSPLRKPVDAILANLPYVPESFVKERPELAHEPPLSLIGGESGAEIVSRMLEVAPRWLKAPGFLLAEIGEEELLEKAREAFPDASVSLIYDLQGLPRVLKIKK